jgi:hypothetical protein
VLRSRAPGRPLSGKEGSCPVETHPPTLIFVESEKKAQSIDGLRGGECRLEGNNAGREGFVG